MSMRRLFQLIGLVLLAAGSPAWAAGEDVYLRPSVFIAETFPDKKPTAAVLSLTGAMQDEIKGFMGRAYSPQRVRYWTDGERTVWILNEIGKTKNITTGYVIRNDAIERVEVLIYRESHGWEVRQPFFTKQFRGASLGNKGRLSQRIDNIAGATLSVRALTKMGKLALFLEEQRRKSGG